VAAESATSDGDRRDAGARFRLADVLPPVGWLRGYEPAMLGGDLLAGAGMLASLAAELGARNITLRVAEARADVRTLLRAADLERTVGRIEHGTSVASVLASHFASQGAHP